MKKSKAIIVLLLILSFTLVSISELRIVKAEPKTIVVPDDYSTIQAAINNASEGDNIFVKSGTYYNQSLVVNKTVSLIGEDAKTTILRGLDIAWQVAQSNSVMDGTDYVLHPVAQSSISSSLGSNVQLLVDKGNNPELSLCNFLPPLTIVIQVEANDVTISGFTITNAFTGFTGSGNGTKIIGNIIRVGTNGMSIGGSYKTIAYNNITGGLHSVSCSGSYNNITKNNIVDPSNLGIGITGSFNTVLGNNITSGPYGNYGYGIQVNGNSNIITENTLSGGSVGIALETASGNTVFGNNVTEHWFMGIHLHDATDNIVYENYIANNVWEHDGYGVSLSGRDYHAENNTFYRNVFINNSYNVRIEAPYYVNYWDNGEEGNYWDDYTCVDNDGDGIGDSAYILYENNQDNYPLVEPYIIPEFPSWTILPLLLVATVLIILCKKRLPKNPSNQQKSFILGD